MAKIAYYKLGISLLLGLWVEAAVAEKSVSEYKNQVLEAITRFENTDRSQWAYKVSRFEDEEGDITSSLELFKPNNDVSKRWELVEQNGEVPSQKQRARFVKRKTGQANKKSKSLTMSMRDLIREETLVLESENQVQFIMGFGVSIERLGDDAQKKLKGKLAFNKQGGFIETIEIENLEAFSPMFMVTISDFALSMTFQQIDDAVLPKENRMRMKGKMSFITEIDEHSVDTFTDYQFEPQDTSLQSGND